MAGRIGELTAAGQDIYLHGRNMGGGFWQAVKEHQDAGLGVFAHPEASLALGDDLGQIRGFGVTVTERAPFGAVPVHLSDFEPGFW